MECDRDAAGRPAGPTAHRLFTCLLPVEASENPPERPTHGAHPRKPGGRPKGLVRRIREESGDGEELVDYMLRVFRAEGESTKTRVEAASWLADRGFGRPQQTTPVGTADARASVSPLSDLSDEELDARLRAFLPDEPAA
jgi:hypothetical protein